MASIPWNLTDRGHRRGRWRFPSSGQASARRWCCGITPTCHRPDRHRHGHQHWRREGTQIACHDNPARPWGHIRAGAVPRGQRAL